MSNSCGEDATCNDGLLIGLIGGPPIAAAGVRLYPSSLVSEWRQLLAQAQDQLGGVSSGIGFFGGPGWVVGASLALGVLEGLASSAKAQEGRRSLQVAAQTYDDIRRAARIFPVAEISHLDLPNPGFWTARYDEEIYVPLGEDFLGVVTMDGRLVQLRWALVASYRAIIAGADVGPPALTDDRSGPDPAAYFLG